MSVSRLFTVHPAWAEAAAEVASDTAERDLPITVEPCGRHSWVTADSEETMALFGSALDGGIECGAIPWPA